MARIHKIHMSLAQIMLRVRADGGEVRFWSTVGGVGYFYVDRTGHHIAGWEEVTSHGVYCVAYYGYVRPEGEVNEPARRLPVTHRCIAGYQRGPAHQCEACAEYDS